MRKNKLLLGYLIFAILIGMSFTFSLNASEKDSKNNSEFTGSFMLGYRFVDINESETKYKEDINLQNGIRLFNLNFSYSPSGDLKKLLDSFDLSLYNFGGDPFESMSLRIIKYGKYNFKYDRRKSVYFYNDKLLGDDYHSFSFDRINDSGLLKVSLGKKSNLYIDFNRYTKTGKSTNSLDLNHTEFEFDKPIDEKSTDVTLGFDYSGKIFSVVLEEKIEDYKNANSMFLPGYADGGDFARLPSALNYFYLDMPYNMNGLTHNVKFTLKPFKNLFMKGGVKIINQDTDITYTESSSGIDLYGTDFKNLYAGEGSFKRDIQLYDMDITYFLSNRVALVANTFLNKFDQTGSLTIDNEKTSMDLKYSSGGFEGGVQYQPSLDFGVTIGFRYEQRDVKDEVVIEDINDATTKLGLFGNIRWKISEKFKLTADYQYGTYETPLTLISPTDFHRFRLTGKYKSKSSYLKFSYLFNKSDSKQESNSWKSYKNQLNLRYGIKKKTLKMFAGYSMIDISRKGSRTLFYPPSWSGEEGSYIWDILFDGTSNLFDFFVYKKLKSTTGLGAYINYYKNNGSWELTRTNLKLFFRYIWKNGLISQINYRYVDFKENSLGYNNYKANIFEISFGYRWH